MTSKEMIERNKITTIIDEVKSKSSTPLVVYMLNSFLSKTISDGVIDNNRILGSQLCCQVDRITLDEAVGIIKENFLKENDEFFFMLISASSVTIAFIIDKLSVVPISHKFLSLEHSFSLISISKIGGCTFDLTELEDEKDIYEFYVAANGEYETFPEKISNLRKDTNLFRHNIIKGTVETVKKVGM